MITIEVKIFKYGNFKEIDIREFSSVKDVNVWIGKILAYTEIYRKESALCGETLEKYTGTFNYDNKSYNVVLDM